MVNKNNESTRNNSTCTFIKNLVQYCDINCKQYFYRVSIGLNG